MLRVIRYLTLLAEGRRNLHGVLQHVAHRNFGSFFSYFNPVKLPVLVQVQAIACMLMNGTSAHARASLGLPGRHSATLLRKRRRIVARMSWRCCANIAAAAQALRSHWRRVAALFTSAHLRAAFSFQDSACALCARARACMHGRMRVVRCA
jgi:hypothetical protein